MLASPQLPALSDSRTITDSQPGREGHCKGVSTSLLPSLVITADAYANVKEFSFMKLLVRFQTWYLTLTSFMTHGVAKRCTPPFMY